MNKEIKKYEDLKTRIYTIRGVKVMLDRDLSELYEVETRTLNQAVKRNLERFPNDFMFQLSTSEWESLRSQFVILKNSGRGYHLKYLPYAFTEQGVAMLSTALKSKTAININIGIMRTFVELRQVITVQPEYELLKQTVMRIESRMDTIEANNLVDKVLISGKTTQLSNDFQGIRGDVRNISELFDQFQNTHIIIKRPDETTQG